MPGRTSDTLSVGDIAPDFSLPAPDGAPVTRSRYQGDLALLLHFFRGTWCLQCRAQVAQLLEDSAEIERRGVRLLGVAVQKRSRLQAFLSRYPHPFPILADENRDQARAWGVYQPFGIDGFRIARPAVFFIGADQRIRFIHVGENQFDRPNRRELMELVTRWQSGG